MYTQHNIHLQFKTNPSNPMRFLVCSSRNITVIWQNLQINNLLGKSLKVCVNPHRNLSIRDSFSSNIFVATNQILPIIDVQKFSASRPDSKSKFISNIQKISNCAEQLLLVY